MIDKVALIRLHEELAVTIDRASVEHFGTFEAQADGHADGVMVQMTCYTADFEGTPTPVLTHRCRSHCRGFRAVR